jgi:hypothetical protein
MRLSCMFVGGFPAYRKGKQSKSIPKLTALPVNLFSAVLVQTGKT